MRCDRPWLTGALLLALFTAPVLAAPDKLTYRQQTLQAGGIQQRVRIPGGYVLELLTDRLSGPRLLSFADNGDLFLGSRSGKVYRLPSPYTQPEVLIELGNYPHSVAFRPGEILIAQTDGIYRAAYQPGQARVSERELSVLAPLPGGRGHNSRTVRVGPDGRIYASLGISGNCSDQYIGADYPFHARRGGVVVLDETSSVPGWQPYASGLRNPVGFDWHPHTGVAYASNNGPDHWGFEMPPEYFSRLDPDSFHGMPWFQFDGRELLRDDCVASPPPRPIEQVSTPAATFPARNAPLGVAFIPRGAMHPALQGDAVVALHGSWATRPYGGASGDPGTRREPKLVLVRFADGEADRVDELISGFQNADGRRWARPAGVAIGPDGALYFTSDAGVNGLFRLRRSEDQTP